MTNNEPRGDAYDVARKHAEEIFERLGSEIEKASERIKKNIEHKLPYLADLYSDSEAIAVAEMGPRYCVVDSGDAFTLEKRMSIRTSSSGDLTNINYEIFKLKGIARNGYTLKFLETLSRLNNLRTQG